jgi:GT2 family glycosyltransferase
VEARGEFVALLDHDDLWPPGKLAWQVTALRAAPVAVLVYGDVIQFGVATRGKPGPGYVGPCGRVRERFLERNWIASPGQTLIRSAAIRAVGGFDERLWGADDWDLYVRLAACGEFLYVPRLALRYRVHGGNASSRVWRMYLNSCRVQRKHLGRFPQPGRLRQWLACRRFILTYCVQRLALSLTASAPD